MKIVAKDLDFSIGQTKILHSIHMEFEDKKFIGIIGPNGSGKSTLLKNIYRVLKPSAGIIEMDGRKLEEYTLKESARKMAVVSQHNGYNFDFTVNEIVLMGRTPYKKQMERDNAEDYDIAACSLKQVGMEDFSERLFSTLSGGEQQRIILARALVQQSECLLLDEPTNHLDIKYQLQLLNLLKNLGTTVVAALHDLNIAAMYCDKLFVLKSGRVVAYGTPMEILTPALIKKVYDVKATVLKDESGETVQVLYKGVF